MANKLIDKKTVRTHDSFYADQDLDAPPKDVFIQIADFISSYKSSLSSSISIADLGCAAGSFPGYLKRRFNHDEIYGYDLLDNLIQVARKNYSDVNFHQASVLDKNSIAANSFEIITSLGVLQIFDDPEPFIDNLLKWIKPGGRIYIHGLFNPHNVDVYLRYNKSEDYLAKDVETGWNIISQETISSILKQKGITTFEFHQFKLSVDLEINPTDPLRSWTLNHKNGDRLITNGLCLIQPQYILEIET